MINNLSVSFKYTKQDVLNFVIEALALEKVRCLITLICIVFLLISGTLMIFLKAYISGILSILAALLFIPIVIFAAYLSIFESIKHISGCVYSLEDNTLITMSNLGSNTINLKDIDRIVISKPIIFIYLSQKTALFIPIRAFNNNDKAQLFISELQKRFNSSKNN